MTKTSFQLHHVIRPQKDETKPAPVLFLFHGFGSNEKDLFALASHVPEDWLVVSARGPLELGPNQYKWFEVERSDEWFDASQSRRKMIVNVESELSTRLHVQGFIDQVVDQYNANKNKIVVAGFSQGAALSLNLFLTTPERFLSAASFSGRVMDEIKPYIVSKEALQAKPVFLGFGSQDPFISAEQAVQTQACLEDLDLKVSVSRDDVPHTISGKHWNDFVSYLSAVLEN